MYKILAIDDDINILNLYKEFLSGFQVELASDSYSAISKFNSFKPDLVILDVDMPAGGGKKVFERIRSIFLSSIPILFVTYFL